eukprot:3296377-Karenia_brevis.AAC.1
MEHRYYMMPDSSHTLSWNGSQHPSPNPGVTATHAYIVEFAVADSLKPWFVRPSHVCALSDDEVHAV